MAATRTRGEFQIFAVERRGKALILSPRGDLIGFARAEVSAECHAIVAQLSDPAVGVLIVDLGRANYFGSELIGFLTRLAVLAQERGQPMALCGASPDMRQVLGVLNLDPLWQHFRTRRAALAALDRVRFLPRARTLLPLAAAVLALLLVAATVAGVQHLRERNADRNHYRTLARLWERFDSLRLQPVSDPRWKVLQREAVPQLESIIAQLEPAATDASPVRQHLLAAARDALLPMIRDPDPEATALEDRFREAMGRARGQIEGAPELVPASIRADAE